MTTIVGYRPEGGETVWMAADSRITGGDFIYPEDAQKIHRCGSWLVGVAGSSRLDELFTGARDWPTVEAMRDEFFGWLKELGLEPIDNRKGDVPGYQARLLAARSGELVEIACNGAIVRPRPSWGFLAVGSGAEYAYGAAVVLDKHRSGPLELVMGAVRAAIMFDTGSGYPITVESTHEAG